MYECDKISSKNRNYINERNWEFSMGSYNNLNCVIH